MPELPALTRTGFECFIVLNFWLGFCFVIQLGKVWGLELKQINNFF